VCVWCVCVWCVCVWCVCVGVCVCMCGVCVCMCGVCLCMCGVCVCCVYVCFIQVRCQLLRLHSVCDDGTVLTAITCSRSAQCHCVHCTLPWTLPWPNPLVRGDKPPEDSSVLGCWAVCVVGSSSGLSALKMEAM